MNNEININTHVISKKGIPKIDYSGLGILFGLTIQAFALIPLIIRVAKTKSANDISYVTPIMFIFSFIIFSVISFSKQYYLPLVIFLVGIVTSTLLLVQKVMYERNRDLKNETNVFDLKKLKLT